MEKFRESFKNIMTSKIWLYILLALFSFFLACQCKEYDFDLFARLIVGEHFVETGEFLYQDFLSYTPTHIWYDHEWGASIIFYLFYKYFGVVGFVIFQALALFGTTFFVIKTQQIQKHAYPASLTFITLFLLLFSHLNPSLVRCHLFSFFFFSVFLYILEKARLQDSKLVWLIPPITILWNNIHGGVVAGLGIVFIYFVGELLSKKPWKRYLIPLLVSIPLLAINPYGFEYLNFLISANTKNRKYITEWWTVFAQKHVMYYYPGFCVMIFAVITSVINVIKAKKLNLTKILILLTTTALGITHVKLMSLSIISIAALCYNDIAELIDKKPAKYLEQIVCWIVFLSLFTIPLARPGIPKVNTNKFPVLETEFIKINNIKGNILTSFGFGSYVSYKLYPNNLIHIDGRYEEVYYDMEFNNLITYELAKEGWEKIYKDYPTEILMPEKESPVYKVLKESTDWQLIYEGTKCGVFVLKDLVKKAYKNPSDEIRYYEVTAFENNGKFGKKSLGITFKEEGSPD